MAVAGGAAGVSRAEAEGCVDMGERGVPMALEERNVRFLTADTAIQGVIQAGIATFVSVFLVRLGAPDPVIGLLTSAPALGAIFLSVPAGARLEGRRDLVRVVNASRLFIRLLYLAIALVPLVAPGAAAIWPIVLLWAATSIPAAVANPAWTAVVAQTVPPGRRATVNGNRWALLSLVTAAFGAGFGWLLDRDPSAFPLAPPLAASGLGRLLDPWTTPLNFQVVFLLSGAAGLVSLWVFGRIRLPDAPAAEGAARRPVVPAARVDRIVGLARKYPPFARFLVTSAVYRIGLNLPVALYAIYWVREAHASNAIIGLQSTVANLALVVSYLLWGRLAARRGHRLVLLAASAGTALYPLATGLVRDPTLLLPVALIWGTFASGIDVSFFEALLRTCPRDLLQTFIGLNAALANLVVFLAPLGGALLAGAVGIRAALFLAAALSLGGSLLFYALQIAREDAIQPATEHAAQN